MSTTHVLKVLCINVGGRAKDRIREVIERHGEGSYDAYCCLETMWEAGGWGGLVFAGYTAHHCTRPDGAPVSGVGPVAASLCCCAMIPPSWAPHVGSGSAWTLALGLYGWT